MSYLKLPAKAPQYRSVSHFSFFCIGVVDVPCASHLLLVGLLTKCLQTCMFQVYFASIVYQSILTFDCDDTDEESHGFCL